MPIAVLDKGNFALAFNEINPLLIRYQQIWRPQPFTDDILPWSSEYPCLYEALLALSDEELISFDNEQCLVNWMTKYLPDLKPLSAWHIAPFEGPLTPMAKFADTGIPGRKKQQIVAFGSAVCKNLIINGPILDWCSGKGHLARHLHNLSKQTVTCLEYDSKLCKDGEQLSRTTQSNVNFIQQDVMQPIDQYITANAHLHTALHACGELHVHMLKTAVVTAATNIACAPCCYHLTASPSYLPMSTEGQQSTLQLDKRDLRLAVLQTVTGGQRVKRMREQELLWRIAFDLLQRQVLGSKQYLPTPSINKQYLSSSFIEYANMMAARTQLTIPLQFNAEQLLCRARQKYQTIIRLEKARLSFRRALEHWLLLDKALFLNEGGYEVALNRFCQNDISPRNTLILASKKQQSQNR